MLSFCVVESFSSNNYRNPSESYVGPSSYTTSFGSDYPGFGNYGTMINFRNPQISSSYSSFGPSSENNEFGSTTFVNYPPTFEQSFSQQNQAPSSYTGSQSWPVQTNSQNIPQPIPTPSYGQVTPISQHVEVTKPVVVPVYKKFPYPVSKKFPVAIPHPVLVPVPAYYPVNVQVSQPIATPVIREIRVPIEREVLYPVERKVPVIVDKPVQYHVEKHFPVYVPKPYPVKVRYFHSIYLKPS